MQRKQLEENTLPLPSRGFCTTDCPARRASPATRLANKLQLPFTNTNAHPVLENLYRAQVLQVFALLLSTSAFLVCPYNLPPLFLRKCYTLSKINQGYVTDLNQQNASEQLAVLLLLWLWLEFWSQAKSYFSGEKIRWLCIRAPSAGTPLSRLCSVYSKLKQNLHSHQLHFSSRSLWISINTPSVHLLCGSSVIFLAAILF